MWTRNHLTYIYKGPIGTKGIEKEVTEEITGLHMRTLVAYDHANEAYSIIEKSRKHYIEKMDKLFDDAEDAWFRVKDYAKQEMFDENEDEWDDWDEIGDYEMDKHFDENYFVDYFTQEIGHNMKNLNWNKYLSKLNFDKWNNDYQGLEDYIESEYLSPLKDEINDIHDKYKKAIDYMVKEYNANKYNMIRLAIAEGGKDEWDVDWVNIE